MCALLTPCQTHPSHKKLSDEVQIFLLQHDVREKGKQGFCCSADTERTRRSYKVYCPSSPGAQHDTSTGSSYDPGDDESEERQGLLYPKIPTGKCLTCVGH